MINTTNPLDISASSRRFLVYNHNPKAAGKSIIEFLEKIKESANYKRRSITRSELHEAKNKKNAFGVINEFRGSRIKEREIAFVIGSIREPCAQYLSLWSFGSTRRGLFQSMIRKRNGSSLYGQNPPFFNSTDDLVRFQTWMSDPRVIGLIAKRFEHSYGKNGEGVDCWIFVEKFQQSLLQCLKEFENQGGYVKWTESVLVDLVKYNKKKEEHGRKLQNDYNKGHTHGDHNREDHNKLTDLHNKLHNHTNIRRNDGYEKTSTLGDPRLEHHSKCEIYFNYNDMLQFELKPEKFIYKMFGFEGCCQPGNFTSPPIVPFLSSSKPPFEGGNLSHVSPETHHVINEIVYDTTYIIPSKTQIEKQLLAYPNVFLLQFAMIVSLLAIVVLFLMKKLLKTACRTQSMRMV